MVGLKFTGDHGVEQLTEQFCELGCGRMKKNRGWEESEGHFRNTRETPDGEF